MIGFLCRYSNETLESLKRMSKKDLYILYFRMEAIIEMENGNAEPPQPTRPDDEDE